MTNEEKKKEAKRRYSEGYSIPEIAVELEINENTLRSWKRRGEWKVSASKKVVQKKEARKKSAKTLKKILDDESESLMQNKFLTSKQKLFCAYYCNCFNATQAYQKAYGCSRKTAGTAGYNLLKKLEIQKVIEEIQQTKLATALAKEDHVSIAQHKQEEAVEQRIEQTESAPGTMGVALIQNMPRPDKNGPHRVLFEKNKKKIYATQSVCAICGHPVDFSLRYPHPMSPCIDHVIPVTKGGHPSDIDNLQLAHLICNRQKSDKIVKNDTTPPQEEQKISNRVLPQSVDWRTF
jgi:putative ATPase subunit of terminase (gpP-like)